MVATVVERRSLTGEQARDMPQQVLMALIGIHYRLLFRVQERSLLGVDLVTRESLQTTLKRWRSA